MLIDDMVEKIKKLPPDKRRELSGIIDQLFAKMMRRGRPKKTLQLPTYSCKGKVRDFTRAELYEEHI